jgi:S1-C subfamily serine protease
MNIKSGIVSAMSAVLMGSVSIVPSIALAPAPAFAQANRTDEQIAIDVYAKANPAVVTLRTGSGSGSGSIIDSSGLVITNEHVVRSSNGTVEVRTANGRTYLGDVIAIDRRNDLALVRLRTNDRLPTIPLANANGIAVGQRVFAIGAPFGLSGTLTTGILSRIDPRTGDLQTDAVLNPGNSGGPLLNSRGEMIGVNKAIRLTPSGGNSGISFATSVLAARTFIAQNANRPPIASAPRPDDDRPTGPRLGITVNTETLMIESVQPNSLASRNGLRPGDRLVGLNGRRLYSVMQLVEYLDSRPRTAVLTVQRGRQIGNLRLVF